MNLRTLGAVAMTSSLLFAGCGGSPTAERATQTENTAAEAIYTEFNSLDGPERETKLLDAARAEGELSIYTSNTDLEDFGAAFEEKYGINVTVYRAGSETVIQRILQESAANYPGADIVELSGKDLDALNTEGLLAEYRSELRDRVRPEGQKENWTADMFNSFVVGWNSAHAPAEGQPTSLRELAEPQWRGRVSMEIGDVDWFAAMYKYYESTGSSDEEIMSFFRSLAANSKIAKGHTVQSELLSAGQFDVAVSVYAHAVEKAAAQGAPVAWLHPDGMPVQPVVVRPNGAGLMKSAAHPAAAVLFMDFLLSDGQDMMVDAHRTPSVPIGHDPLAGVEVVSTPDAELLRDPKRWNDLYASVIQRGEET